VSANTEEVNAVALGHRALIDTQAKARVLIEALPYITEYAGRRIVVKVGGEVVDDPTAAASFAADLVLLKAVGINVVLCHGGGPQISREMANMGREPTFVNGLRVTDAETMEITAMVLLGVLNRNLVSLLNVHGPQAVGVSGVDGRLFVVEPERAELGYVGRIREVTPDPVVRLLDDGYIPVVASIGMDDTGAAYNVNADLAAGRLAAAIGAEKYVLLTNVEGLYESFGDADTLISEIDRDGLRALRDGGSLSAGMVPKVDSILTALDGGVGRAHILDGRVEHAVLLEIFTPEGIGTMVRGSGRES
jgi:acetylglutamate kinase